MPFKLFVLTAGVLHFRYSRFILATTLGRIIRYGIWGVLAVIFRDYIKYFMQNHLLKVGIVILAVLALGCLGGYFYALRKRRSQRAEAVRSCSRRDEINSTHCGFRIADCGLKTAERNCPSLPVPELSLAARAQGTQPTSVRLAVELVPPPR